MEYCCEGTLADACKECLSEELIRYYTDALLSAVHELHRRGIVHRDIKSKIYFLFFRFLFFNFWSIIFSKIFFQNLKKKRNKIEKIYANLNKITKKLSLWLLKILNDWNFFVINST